MCYLLQGYQFTELNWFKFQRIQLMDGQQIEPLLYLKPTHEPLAHVSLKLWQLQLCQNGHTEIVLKFQKTSRSVLKYKLLVIRA